MDKNGICVMRAKQQMHRINFSTLFLFHRVLDKKMSGTIFHSVKQSSDQRERNSRRQTMPGKEKGRAREMLSQQSIQKKNMIYDFASFSCLFFWFARCVSVKMEKK